MTASGCASLSGLERTLEALLFLSAEAQPAAALA